MRRLLLAEQRDQLVVDDLDELLAGPDLLERRDADGLGLHPLEKLAGQIEADVGLEQDPADLPEPFLDRILREDATTGELLERGGEFAGQLVEHKPVSITGRVALDKRRGAALSVYERRNAARQVERRSAALDRLAISRPESGRSKRGCGRAAARVPSDERVWPALRTARAAGRWPGRPEQAGRSSVSLIVREPCCVVPLPLPMPLPRGRLDSPPRAANIA